MLSGPLTMSPGIFHRYHHRMGDFAWMRRVRVNTDISNDEGTITKRQLGAVVLSDPDPLNESECLRKPFYGSRTSG